ncbi:Methyltransferase-like protein 24 [Gonapodya sp. JEL0774]|nr:Methyltransferase-like protein 24 [Gonapodya sp. JEL0774]
MVNSWTPSRAVLAFGIAATIFISILFLFADDLVLLRSRECESKPLPALHRLDQPNAVGPADPLGDQSVFWDRHSAVFSLMFRFNRNLYSLGGAPSGDGVWPVCFDGWDRMTYTNPSRLPEWLTFKPKPKHGRRDLFESSEAAEASAPVVEAPQRASPHGFPLSRRTVNEQVYFRPGVALGGLDRYNGGLERVPEPMIRPNETYSGLQQASEFGLPASQKELGNDPPCVVYTFGVDWDFSWEDEFHNMTGCETHSFDPSMRMESHYRGRNQWFWNIGLSSESTQFNGVGLRTGQADLWQVLTLKDHMETLGHKHINLLKIDIEGHEWDALARALADGVLDNVEQVLFEVHMFDDFFRKWKPQPPGSETTGSEATPSPIPTPPQNEDLRVIEGLLGWVDLLDQFEKSGFSQYYHHTNPMSIQSIYGPDRGKLCEEER